MISVIIPAYNREKTIERAVSSVLSQTETDLEVIVVDDASTDRTGEIVRALAKKEGRLIYSRLEKNSGACAARNKGIALAKGEYIAFQDSDDEWFARKLEIQLEAMRKNGADISFCQFNRISGSEKAVFPQLEEGFVPRGTLLAESIVSTQTLLAARECFSETLFDERMPRLQDYDICIRLSEIRDFYFVRQPLVNMYVQPDSISQSWEKLQAALELIFEKYPALIKQNKEMEYRQSSYLALAKQMSGKSAVRERLRCFALHPDRANLKQLVKAVLLKMNLTEM